MSIIIDVVRAISSNSSITLPKAQAFVKEAWTINNPGKVYDDGIMDKVIATGFLNNLIQGYYEIIVKNPSKFNLDIMDVLAQNGRVVKRIIKERKVSSND